MAKEDFCFTYYDGDAARDTTHMNRLERGAYHDIIISQRKFGHLTGAQITKILGRDFDECWPAIELILKVDGDGKFFVDWLDVSITKMRAQSKKQSNNVSKRYQTSTNNIPKDKSVIPLEDGIGNGIPLKEKESKIVQIESIEEKLTDALDEIYIDQQRMKWSHIDFDMELFAFMEKVRGSPEHYKDHTTGGMRLAFQAQLRNAKKKPNGKAFNKNDRTEFNQNELAIIAAHASSGGGPQKR